MWGRILRLVGETRWHLYHARTREYDITVITSSKLCMKPAAILVLEGYLLTKLVHHLKLITYSFRSDPLPLMPMSLGG